MYAILEYENERPKPFYIKQKKKKISIQSSFADHEHGKMHAEEIVKLLLLLQYSRQIQFRNV